MINFSISFNRILAAVLIGIAFTGFSWSAEKTVKKKTPTPVFTATPSLDRVKIAATGTPTIGITSPTISPTSPSNIASATPITNPILAEVQKRMDANSPKSHLDPTQELMTRTGGESIWKYIGESLISLALVILLALGLAWGAKRFLIKNKKLGGGHIVLMGSYALSPKSQVHLIRVGEEYFLIGEGNTTVSLISQVNPTTPILETPSTPTSEPTEEIPYTPAFSERLSQWQNAIQNRDLKQEVQASLHLLSGLSKRLHKKGGGES